MFGSEGEDTIEVGITFSIFYALFTLCFITQSMEFKSAGISPEAVLEAVGWLSQSQDLSFCQFQLRRTSGNLVIHRYGHYHINYFFIYFTIGGVLVLVLLLVVAWKGFHGCT